MLAPHARAPSTEATLFLNVERLQPPPPRPVTAYRVTCEAQQPTTTSSSGSDGCVKAATAAAGPIVGEYVVRLSPEGQRLNVAA